MSNQSVPIADSSPADPDPLHAARNGIGGVVGWTEFLRAGGGGTLTPRQVEIIGRILRSAEFALHALKKLDSPSGPKSSNGADPVVASPLAVAEPSAVHVPAIAVPKPAPVAEALPPTQLFTPLGRSSTGWLRDPRTGHWRARALTARAPLSSPAAIGPGTRIGEVYQVQGVIGRGGMGVVLQAHDDQLDREVAIKLIHPECIGDDYARAQFLREARAMAKLKHPNVAEIHAFGEIAGTPYLVMEYVPGIDLESHRSSNGGTPLAVDEALGILEQLCAGVTAIHAAGAVHRDLKHGNVLIGPAFRVVVTDFGLARRVDDADAGARIAGTPGFMPPELLLQRPTVPALAARSDVYALGVIAFELLTGATLFDAPSLAELAAQHCFATPPRPSDIREDLPPGFDAPILRALAKDPAERTPSASELRRELFAARSALGAAYGATRVLIVDDDAEWRDLLQTYVRESLPAARVEAASDGAAALAAARTAPPTIALVDLQIPRMNGLALIEALRSSVPTHVTEVVVVTGHGGANDWERLRRLGVAGFFVKPVDATALGAVLRRLTLPSTRAERPWIPLRP